MGPRVVVEGFYCILQITIYSVLDGVFSKGEVRKVLRQAPSIGGSLELYYWGTSSGHNRLSLLSAKRLKRPLISWLLC